MVLAGGRFKWGDLKMNYKGLFAFLGIGFLISFTGSVALALLWLIIGMAWQPATPR